jgi:hypothetical protein
MGRWKRLGLRIMRGSIVRFHILRRSSDGREGKRVNVDRGGRGSMRGVSLCCGELIGRRHGLGDSGIAVATGGDKSESAAIVKIWVRSRK